MTFYKQALVNWEGYFPVLRVGPPGLFALALAAPVLFAVAE